MKKIFYGLTALALLAGCSSEEMVPETPKEGPVQLASVGVGPHTRGVLIDDNFVFGSGDQVLMSAMVNGSTVYNTFTYDGNKWTQDIPAGNYSTICWQDNPTIETVVSSGGKPARPTSAVRSLDQSSEEKYTAAYLLKADSSLPMGSISITDGKVSAELAHACVDFVVKVRDGRGAANVLDEDTPVLTVTIDQNGLAPGSVTDDYITWNTGKSQDEDGNLYTTFRVILPDKCTVLKATLSKVNATAGDATTEMNFYWKMSGDNYGDISSKIELKRGNRYTATYSYEEYLPVGSTGLFIDGFVPMPETDIVVGLTSAGKPDWAPQTRVSLTDDAAALTSAWESGDKISLTIAYQTPTGSKDIIFSSAYETDQWTAAALDDASTGTLAELKSLAHQAYISDDMSSEVTVSATLAGSHADSYTYGSEVLSVSGISLNSSALSATGDEFISPLKSLVSDGSPTSPMTLDFNITEWARKSALLIINGCEAGRTVEITRGNASVASFTPTDADKDAVRYVHMETSADNCHITNGGTAITPAEGLAVSANTFYRYNVEPVIPGTGGFDGQN